MITDRPNNTPLSLLSLTRSFFFAFVVFFLFYLRPRRPKMSCISFHLRKLVRLGF
jgi:hypothetical protein